MVKDSPHHQRTAPFESDEYWDEYIEVCGLEATIAHQAKMRAGPAAYGKLAIKRERRRLEDLRILRSEERGIEALRLANEANTMARSTMKVLKLTWIVGAVVAVILVLFF